MNGLKVAVIVPIFNVEKYLKECLDSIINQSYKNIEAILVNDGSNDSNSLNIAKEYVSNNENFILIDKPNLGLSSARNVALDFLSQSYKLKLDSIESNLLTYKVINENTYNIKAIYANKDSIESKILEIQRIDYIIFLDSDDYWKSDCVQSCINAVYKSQEAIANITGGGGGNPTLQYNTKDTNIESSNKISQDYITDSKNAKSRAQIIWFEYEHLYDGLPAPKEKDLGILELIIGAKEEKLITNKDFVNYLIKNDRWAFSFVWQGLIDFKFLQSIKLRFINKVIHEDFHFGSILFANAEYIYILPKKLIVYRVRPGSICNREGVQNLTKQSMPTYTHTILDAFKGDVINARSYYRAASWFIMFLEIKQFIESNPANNMSKFIKERSIGVFVNESRLLLQYDIDPLNLANKFGAFKDYIKPENREMKIAINKPQLYKKILPLIRIYKKLKRIEQRFRKFIKQKNIRFYKK